MGKTPSPFFLKPNIARASFLFILRAFTKSVSRLYSSADATSDAAVLTDAVSITFLIEELTLKSLAKIFHVMASQWVP